MILSFSPQSDSAASRIKTLLSSHQEAVGVRLGAFAEVYSVVKCTVALTVTAALRTRGCNGMSFVMDYAKETPSNHDIVKEKGPFIHFPLFAKQSLSNRYNRISFSRIVDVTVFVDRKASMHIIGTQMDWVEDSLKAEFVFHNPNATGHCGCGESFSVQVEIDR